MSIAQHLPYLEAEIKRQKAVKASIKDPHRPAWVVRLDAAGVERVYLNSATGLLPGDTRVARVDRQTFKAWTRLLSSKSYRLRSAAYYFAGLAVTALGLAGFIASYVLGWSEIHVIFTVLIAAVWVIIGFTLSTMLGVSKRTKGADDAARQRESFIKAHKIPRVESETVTLLPYGVMSSLDL